MVVINELSPSLHELCAFRGHLRLGWSEFPGSITNLVALEECGQFSQFAASDACTSGSGIACSQAQWDIAALPVL
jgi:hypothetical protein